MVSSSIELLIIESYSVQAKAIKDHCNIYDPNTLYMTLIPSPLKKGT